jgi:sugar/nucleoside kinase (ribokinase family)
LQNCVLFDCSFEPIQYAMDHHVGILGGTTYDHIVYLDQFPSPFPHTIHQAAGFYEGPGSTGMGKALALSKLGVSNTLYSVAGDDLFGKKIKAYLDQNNMDYVLETDPKGTERHINIMDAEGRRISIFVTQSSEIIGHDQQVVERILARSSVIVLNIIAYCRQLVPLVKKSGKPVWTDLHDYDGSNTYHDDFIEAAGYIHLSSDNLEDYKTTMKRFIDSGKEMVVCTHGRKGATLLTKEGKWLEQTAIEGMEIVDSNGAGDSFFAGFLTAWLQEKNLVECLQHGAVCGAYAVTSHALTADALSPQFLKEKLKEHFL